MAYGLWRRDYGKAPRGGKDSSSEKYFDITRGIAPRGGGKDSSIERYFDVTRGIVPRGGGKDSKTVHPYLKMKFHDTDKDSVRIIHPFFKMKFHDSPKDSERVAQ